MMHREMRSGIQKWAQYFISPPTERRKTEPTYFSVHKTHLAMAPRGYDSTIAAASAATTPRNASLTARAHSPRGGSTSRSSDIAHSCRDRSEAACTLDGPLEEYLVPPTLIVECLLDELPRECLEERCKDILGAGGCPGTPNPRAAAGVQD